MFNRRKRMQYDPPGQRKRRKRDTRHLRVDQIELSRRTLLMKTGLVGVFITMATKLGIMQLAQGEKYKKQAERNVIRTVPLPAARGLIVDRRGRRLAQNRRAWELRILPNKLPDKNDQPVERERVINTLISALQIEDTLVARDAAIRKGTENDVFSRVAALLGLTGDTATDTIEYWKKALKKEIYLNLTPNGGLSQDDAARFRAFANELPGILVMNRLVWQIENSWNPRLPVTVSSDVPRETALKLEANRMYLPGVELDDSALVRHYTGGDVMSHVVGYVQPIQAAQVDDPRYKGPDGEKIYNQNDVIGATGVEAALENELRGVRGRQNVEQDAIGVQMRVMPDSTIEPVNGKNVWLTIDLELQRAVGDALEKGIQRAAEAKVEANKKRKEDGRDRQWKIPVGGAVVAYDPRNGEIHAMVSYPYYDNQLFISGISSRKWNEYIQEGGPQAFLNRCTNEAYAPGSTFKMFLAASALDRGSLTTDDVHYCTGAITVPNTANYNQRQPFACWTGWTGNRHESQDVYSAIEQSCDVFFYNVAPEREEPAGGSPVFYWDYDLLSGTVLSETKHVFDGEGIANIAEDMTEKFYFGRRTGIEIAEIAGNFPTPAKKVELLGEGWVVGDSLNISIGQGDFRATPLQMAFNTGILAADGKVRTPKIVLKQTDDLPRSSTTVAPTPTSSAPATPEVAPEGTPGVESTPEDVVGPFVAATPPPVELTPPDAELGMKQSAIDVVKEGMRRVVEGSLGTAPYRTDDQNKWPMLNPSDQLESGALEYIPVAGKTGTAEFGLTDDLGAADSHAWFTAYSPIENPEIAVAVIIDGGGEGSTFAVPVADSVLRAYFELTGRRPRGVMLSKDPMPV